MSNNQALGIDFYSANGGVWSLVAKNNPTFAFIGATVGVRTYYQIYKGRPFNSDWAKAQTFNLLRGAYHLYIEGVDPTAQANTFVSVVNDAGGGYELPLVLDLEVSTGHPNPRAPGVLACLQAIEAQTHHKPIIYTSAHMWKATVGDANWATNYDLWVAGFPPGQQVGYHTPPEGYNPRIPKSWADSGQTWKFWQYADIGTDLDVFAGDINELRTYAAQH